MKIENNRQTFVRLWLMLERTRKVLRLQYKRFCPRNIIKLWNECGIISFGAYAPDEYMLEICIRAELLGLDELHPPRLYPRKNRELLRAIASLAMNIGMRKVNLKALDEAYSEAFPNTTPLNINKKKKEEHEDMEFLEK